MLHSRVLALCLVFSLGLWTVQCGGTEGGDAGGAEDIGAASDTIPTPAPDTTDWDATITPDTTPSPDADIPTDINTLTDVVEDAGAGTGHGFGDPCETGDDCYSGLCAEHMGDTVCTKTCNDDCPAGWSCDQVTGASGDPIYICVSSFEHLCRPCMSGDDCTSESSESACIDYDGQGAFCGAHCDADADCPEGFVCQESVSTRGGTSSQCVDQDGVCACSSLATDLGLATSCSVTSEAGTCEGIRTCTDTGLTDCDAATPTEETCNGTDDDCDGETDNVGCDDANPCTTDSCAGSDGCAHEITPGAECDDGDLGTRDDACNIAGECSGWPIQCLEAECILDAEPNGTDCDITYKVQGALCDDGDATTQGDQCDGADVCQGTAYTCEPGLCEIASVPNGTGCDVEYWAMGTACDDGEPGTQGDLCDGSGGCAGTPYTCEPAQCEAESTPDGQGCVATPKIAGSACDDEAVTTHNDACDGQGACVGTTYGCEAGLCVDASAPNGQDCDVTYTPEGVGCDDGDPNTKTDACDGQGACVGQAFACEATQCEAASVPDGAGCAVQYKVAGYSCDDGDAATADDACDGQGGCAGQPYACELGVCQASVTPNGVDCDVAFTPAGVGCDDGDATTKIDACDGSGGCAGTSYACEASACIAASVPNGVDCDVTFMAVGIGCDDGDPATQSDLCDGQGGCAGTPYGCAPGLCEIASVPDGEGCDVTYAIQSAACDDGDAGTLGDQCDGFGGCQGTPYACIAEQCDVSSSPNGFDCDVDHAASGTPCSDGDDNTKDDQCDGGGACLGDTYGCVPTQCEASSVADGDGCAVSHVAAGIGCDDGDDGTQDDLCDGMGGCAGTPYTCEPTQCELQSIPDGVGCVIQNAPASVACDDGDASTKVDVCDGFGGCAGTPYVCEPAQCDADSVPDGTGCAISPKAQGVDCDDGQASTKDDQCDGQSLCAGTPYTCEPGTCELASTPDGVGCEPVYAQAETPCDDQDLFTKVDICDGQGGCAGTAYTCEADQCDAASNPNGADCDVVPKASGFDCDDGDLTTADDQCDGQGGCVGTPYACPTTQCEASASHNGVGCDVTNHAATVACDDGDLTTQSDLCDGQGGCAGTPYACLAGQCDVSATHNGEDCDVVHHEATVACDDADLTTKTDLCDGQGGCQGTLYDCTATQCEASSTHDGEGCEVVYHADTVDCDDDDLTTQEDLCDGSGGCHGTPYDCVATQCEASSVHDGEGCEVVNHEDTVGCDDEDPATVGDLCDGAGACAGVLPVCGDGAAEGLEDCDDGNDDETDGCTSECQAIEVVPAVLDAATAFTHTGVDQEFTVPAHVHWVRVACWGAGGSSLPVAGAGGFAEATLHVTPGETMTVVVGGSGPQDMESAAYGGGGLSDHRGGGGWSGLLSGEGGWGCDLESQGRAVLIAAGGGGVYDGQDGGDGGGLEGHAGDGDTAGGAGTQFVGGAASQGNSTAGQPLCGGAGGASTVNRSGGGGGGFFGGGGGFHEYGSQGGPGGGGSSFIGNRDLDASAMPWSGISTFNERLYVDGHTVSAGGLGGGGAGQVPQSGHVDYADAAGTPSVSTNTAGQHGRCVVRYASLCGDGVSEGVEECDDGNDVVGDGCSPTCDAQHTSCRAIRDADAASPDGTYWIDPDGAGGTDPFQVYCDMTHDGGGWTLVAAVHRADSYDVSEPKTWFVGGQNSAPLATNTDTFDATPSSFGAAVWAPLLVGDTAVARFDVHAHLDFDVRHSWFKGAPAAAFSQWFADDTTATDVCLDVALTEGCQSGRIQHTGDKTELTGMNLTAHGYPADNHLHMRQDGESSGQFSAVCSSTGDNDGNAWPDSGMDGHWGNGLRIWLRPVVCGDGLIEGGETCEDGNTDAGDGCSDVCKSEIYVDCAALLQATPGLGDGPQTIDPDGDGAGAPFEVFCDMDGDGGPYTLPVWTPDAPGLVHFYDFTQAPNRDFRGTGTLAIAGGEYSDLGLNLNGLSTGGDYVYYAPGDTIILTMRRDFSPASGKSGMVFSTSGTTDDDGITINGDHIGTRTHTSSYKLKGTNVTTLLPTEGASESFGMRMQGQGATFNHGGGWTSVLTTSGEYDNCTIDSIYLGSNQYNVDPWDDGDLYVQTLAVFDIEVSDQVLSDYLANLSLLFP